MVLRRNALVFILAALLVAACGKTASPPPKTPQPPTATATPTAVPPTATPTPAPPAAVLVASPQADTGLKNDARHWLQALAQQEGLHFVELTSGKPLPPHTVVALGVGVIPPQAAGARRLVVAPPENADLKGVQWVNATTADLPHRAFLAGYLAAVVTYDWRGGLLASENEKAAAAAFEDGGRYFCGLCRPLHPPFLAYPQYALAPAGATEEEWDIALQRLTQAAVKTLVLSPAALAALNNAQTPPNTILVALENVPVEAQTRFAAAIRPDLSAALNTLWQHPNTAKAPLPLVVDVWNATVVTPGKLRLIEEVQRTLEQGLIAP